MTVAVQFVLDEHVEHEVLHRLEKVGYDAIHVEFTPELGKGTNDKPISTFSLDTERVIITYDGDFLEEFTEADYYGVVYFDDETLSAKQVSDIVDTMASHYPEERFQGFEYGSQKWL